MGRPGFTLMEVVIALALVVALAAIAMPSIGGRLGSARSEAVARDLRSSVAQARGDAVRDGVSYRVLLAPSLSDLASPAPRWRLIARAYRSGQASTDAIGEGFVGPIFDEPSGAESATSEAPDRVLLDLGRGVSVSREAPAGEAGSGQFGGGGDGPDEGGAVDPWLDVMSEGSGDASGLTLGVLLATGAAVAGAPVYVTLGDGRVLEVRLDAWTGALRAEAWEPAPLLDPWEGGAAGDASGSVGPSGAGGRP